MLSCSRIFYDVLCDIYDIMLAHNSKFQNMKIKIRKGNRITKVYYLPLWQISFIDNIIIGIKEEKGYNEVIEEVIKRLVENNLYIKSEKYKWKFRKVGVKIKESGLDLFYFSFHFYFSFDLFFYFLFLEQLGLGLIGHAVTSVTTWWHKTDHETWEKEVEGFRTKWCHTT